MGKVGLLVVLVLVLGVILIKGWEPTKHTTENFEELKTISEALTIIQKNYVDKTNAKNLVRGAIRGMLSTLDPDSTYMTPNIFKKELEDSNGELSGVGISILVKEGCLMVTEAIEDSPAYKAGIKSGDFITEINHETTKGLTTIEATLKIRGPKGSKVSLTIQRDGTPDLLQYMLVRDMIKIESVKLQVLGTIGYIRLTKFLKSTGGDLVKVLKQFKEQNLHSMILDLRDNSGGLLTTAVEVCEQFLPSGMLVVYLKKPKSEYEWISKGKDQIDNSPMIILINERSASASELVAGTLQDYGRAVIVGTTSHGKGTAQNDFPMKDGSGLHLTTGRYYTAKGRSVQSTGITPDIVVKSQPPAIVGKEKAKSGDPSHGQDFQLQKAMEILKTWKTFKKLPCAS